MIVVQSRLASTRLPAKALLPIGNLPSVVLCARRAANTGLRVVVATSDTPTDDSIAEVVSRAGIGCIRGSHHDVLRRFVTATRSLADEDVVVRLTADNVFPDGSFIEMLLDQFARSGASYLGTDSPRDGLPYGMSAEVFSASVLRQADSAARTPAEREHVTPWIRRQARTSRYYHAEAHACWSRLRCTLDTFEDYEVLQRVFAGLADPVQTGWRELVERLADASLSGRAARCPYRVIADGTVHSVLTLGAVQLGMKYGIANNSGMPADAEAREILRVAADAGITSIDTARAYGSSEERIGSHLPGNFIDRIRVTTKLDVLSELPADASPALVARAVDASVFRSLNALRRRRLDALLLHRWAHRSAWHGAAWARLQELQASGVIGVLGASVQEPTEALEALNDPGVGQLQCPVNILDHRWRDERFLAAVEARPQVLIHSRSALLQGMLTLPPKTWVSVPGVDAVQICGVLDEFVQSFRRADRVDLCMAYVRSLPWITSVVIGVDRAAQLQAHLALVQSPALADAQRRVIEARLPQLPEAFLNPALWKS